MSDYRHALESRKESLEAALLELDEARSDSFTDHKVENAIDDASSSIKDALDQTGSELEVLKRDWETVVTQVEDIIENLSAAAEKMAAAGIASYNREMGTLSPTLDDEPDELRDAREYIERALADWSDVRHAAAEARADAETGGRY